MNKIGELKPATKAFVDWYDSRMTQTLEVSFNDISEAKNWKYSVSRFIKKHYTGISVSMTDSFTVLIFRLDDENVKYNGSVRFSVLRGGEVSHMAWVNLQRDMMKIAKRQKEAGMKARKERAKTNGN